jgi:serine protease AprX
MSTTLTWEGLWRRGAILGLGIALLASTTETKGDTPARLRSARAREVAAGKGSAKVNVLVRFRQTPGAAERALVQTLGGQERRKLKASARWASVRLPANRVAMLADHAAVDHVAIDEPVGNAMDIARKAAYLPVAPAPESLLKGAGITIAVVDSGIALHPDIPTLTAVVDVVGQPAPYAAPPETSVDPFGHGTHVAGIIAGNGGQSGGLHAGVAPEASLISVRVLGNTGTGLASDVLAGLQWIADHHTEYGIRVANLSLGHPIYEPASVDPLVQAVDELWDAGVVVVCSAGNRGRDGFVTITSPCNSRKAITVGATNDRRTTWGWDDRVATYSSRGPTTFDLVAKPDLVAPGNKLVSLRSQGSIHDTMLPGRRKGNPGNEKYFEMSGTSMASPMVAGTVALMLEQDPTLNPGTVKARLMMSARKARFGNPLLAGAGRLDILAALGATWYAADAPSPAAVADPVSGAVFVENTAVLWGNDAFSLRVLWGDSVAWADPYAYFDPMLETMGEVWPTGAYQAQGEVWPNGEVWPESEVWPDSPAWVPALTSPSENGPVPTEALSVGFCDEEEQP